MTKPKNLRANREAAALVAKREPFVGSSMRGERYTDRSAPHPASNWWLSEYEMDRYFRDRDRIDYVVFSFNTPIAWHNPHVEAAGGWYKVGQVFSSYTSRHQSAALRDVSGHDVRVEGKRGDWRVRCYDCGEIRYFTRLADANRVCWPHA